MELVLDGMGLLVVRSRPTRARSIIVGTRACVGVEFPAAQAGVGALLQATRDAVAERVEIRRLIDGGRRNTLGQWSVEPSFRRAGRCGHALNPALGDLVLQPKLVVLLGPVEIDTAGAHRFERPLHAEGPDIDVGDDERD